MSVAAWLILGTLITAAAASVIDRIWDRLTEYRQAKRREAEHKLLVAELRALIGEAKALLSKQDERGERDHERRQASGEELDAILDRARASNEKMATELVVIAGTNKDSIDMVLRSAQVIEELQDQAKETEHQVNQILARLSTNGKHGS